MMFWVLAALLVAVVAFPLVRALSASGAPDDSVGEDVAFFKAQEVEIDRQLAAGTLSGDEARAAKAEAARKLLVLSRKAANATDQGDARARIARMAVVALVPMLAVGLYLKTGAPGLPDLPFAQRTDIDRADADMRRLIARLDAHLAESPGDVRGWELALPVYMRLSRFEDAVVAAGRILEIKGETAERLTTLAEAMIYRNKGETDDDAAKLLDRALALDPKSARTRFYIALGKEHKGDIPGALGALQALAQDVTEPNEKQAVAAHIARLSKVADNNDTASAIQSMPAGERQQAIRGMVDGLAARLKDSGGKPDEWLRLIRAFSVLGEKDRAVAALSDARKALAQDGDAQAALTVLAKELSLAEGARP